MELNPSISLLIECHGEDIGLLDKRLQSELHERVEYAYKITTNTFILIVSTRLNLVLCH